MFDKDSLRNVAETIVYMNLLLAILATIALYDQWQVTDAGEAAGNEWEKKIEGQIEALNEKIAGLEERLDLLCEMLQLK